MRTTLGLLLWGLLTSSVWAYEIYIPENKISEDVLDTVRAAVQRECPKVLNTLKSLDLEKYSFFRNRIDQGFLEEHFYLVFSMAFNNDNRDSQTLSLKVVKEVENRSGYLMIYVQDFKSTACN
ncbi:MAG: hypothetical protein AB7I27_14430 [Bacteriovoracaceae bacterium]